MSKVIVISGIALLALSAMTAGWMAQRDSSVANVVEESADNQLIDDNYEENITAALASIAIQVPIVAIDKTAMEGVYQVVLQNEDTLYINASGSYFIAGDLYHNSADGFENLSEAAKLQARAAYNDVRKGFLDEVDPASYITYAANGQEKAVITVFTDVECPYCRKLHSEMKQYNDLGITVHYAAYPRAGIGSTAYNKMVSAWCSADPQQALDELKQMKSIPVASCDNPVADQYNLGRKIGVQGTPAIVAADGTMIPGYIPPQQLAQRLGIL